MNVKLHPPRIVLNLTLGLIVILHCSAQVLTTEPQFPVQTDDITIFFDASKGNGALAGYSGTVYAHTGVITSNSSSASDWQHVVGNWGTDDARVKMTSEGNDIYSLSYNIESFYDINAGERVDKLAFVFRNQDGSIVGRNTDGSDIFYDVQEANDALIAQWVEPQDNAIFYTNQNFNIDIAINQASTIEVLLNDVIQFSQIGTGLEETLSLTEAGPATLKINISNATESLMLKRNILVISNSIPSASPPIGTKNGLNINGDDVLFQLTAPGKDHVFLLCPENNFQPNDQFRMTPAPDGDRYWIQLPNSIFDNEQHYYQYLIDGAITIADPYSTQILDPSNDASISSTWAERYPAATSGHVSVATLLESPYDWNIVQFDPPKKEDLIIYELLVRDFLNDRQFTSLTDTLDYLNRLGINAIELMPVQEFENNGSWGYNPSYHMALDKEYGTINEFKQFVDACHARGIAVILDVVYNHAFGQSPLCQMYWDPVNARPTADNPWLNTTARHPFNVGYDFNHESTYTKQWVKEVTEYWIEEFKIDGFRFDLSKGFTQTNSVNDPDLMAQYDQSRIDILTDYANHIWSLDSDNIVILEHFAESAEEKALAVNGMLVWNNIQFQFAEAAMGYSSNLSGADYVERGFGSPALVTYLESHDEERMAYKIEAYGNSNSDYSTKTLPNLRERMVAAYTIFMTIPGPKMIWQFSELGYNYSINRCITGAINNDCRLVPKPIVWSYQSNMYRQDLYNKLSALFKFKNESPVFSSSNYTLNNSDSYLKSVIIEHEDQAVVSMANFDIVDRTINIQFPTTGTWYEFYTGATLEVNSGNMSIDLAPGTYKLFSTDQSAYGGDFTVSTLDPQALDIAIYPNPVDPLGMVYFSDRLSDIQVFDISGKQVFSQNTSSTSLDISALDNGIYFLHALLNGRALKQKVVKLK